jgi:hypothetical protein
MSVTAPPRPPRHREPAPPDPGGQVDPEALIEEAQRARRRRRKYAAAAVLLALTGLALILVLRDSEPPLSAAPEPAALPGASDVDEATVVAAFEKWHVGWVYVYDDGRVISFAGTNAFAPDSASRYTLLERRLTARGVDLVSSGAIHPDVFLKSTTLPARVWADAEYKPYRPPKYAVFSTKNPTAPPEPEDGASLTEPFLNPTEIARLFPAPVVRLVGGKERTYHPFSVGLVEGPGRWAPVVGSELTPGEARALAATVDDAGFFTNDPSAHGCGWDAMGPDVRFQECRTLLTNEDGREVEIAVFLSPILPHGEGVFWGE